MPIRTLAPHLWAMAIVAMGCAQDAAPIWESFEDADVPRGWTVIGGSVQITDRRYKSGAQSLCWTWNHPAATLTFSAPAAFSGLTPPEEKAPGTALALWLHSDREQEGFLWLDLMAGGEVAGRCWVDMDFRGWRPIGVPYSAVLPDPEASVDAVRLHAPEGSPAGRLHLDYITFGLQAAVPRSYQVPWIGVDGGLQDPERCRLTAEDISVGRPWLVTRPRQVAEEEAEDLDRIATRVLAPVAAGTGDLEPGVLDGLRQQVAAWAIRLEGDAVTGRPVDLASFARPPDFVALGDYMAFCGRVASATRNTGNAEELAELQGMFVALTAHLLDQGWGYGSGLRGAGNGYVFRDWPPIFYPLRQVLAEAGLLRETALCLLYQMGGAEGALAEAPVASMDTLHLENKALLPLVSLLPDAAERLQWMRAVQRYYSLVLLNPSTTGPDGSAYHHWMHHFAYASYSMPFPITAAHTMADTVFRIGPEAHQRLRQYVYAMSFALIGGSQPPNMNGRAGTPLSYDMTAQARLLAEMGTPDGERPLDPLMAGLYLTLTDKPDEAPARQWREAGIAPLELTGHLTMNGTAAALHRRDGWLISAVGMIKFWRGLEIYGWLQNNNYGRYARNGSVLLAGGSPPSVEGGGYSYDGWNWCHWPGSTSPVRPSHEMFDGYAMYGNPSTFAGGTSLEGDGIFGLDFQGGDVQFRKSVFCFDDRVTVVTTDIHSEQQRPVATTLWQNAFAPDAEKLTVNGETVGRAPWETEITGAEACRVVDNKGTGYYLYPDHPPLHLALQEQQWTYMMERYLKDPADNPIIDYQKRQYRHRDMARNEAYFNPTRGTFALGYFSHGMAPAGAHCAWTMIPKCTPQRIEAFAAQMSDPDLAPCRLLRRDEQAHILWDRATDTTAYVLFAAGEDVGVEGLLRRVTRPCLVMVRRGQRELAVSVASTDISNTEPIVLTLAGHWKPEEGGFETRASADATMLTVPYTSYTPTVVRLRAG